MKLRNILFFLIIIMTTSSLISAMDFNISTYRDDTCSDVAYVINDISKLVQFTRSMFPRPQQRLDFSQFDLKKYNAMINVESCNLYYYSNDVDHIEVLNMGKVLHVYFATGGLLTINPNVFCGVYLVIKADNKIMLAKKEEGKIVKTWKLEK